MELILLMVCKTEVKTIYILTVKEKKTFVFIFSAYFSAFNKLFQRILYVLQLLIIPIHFFNFLKKYP